MPTARMGLVRTVRARSNSAVFRMKATAVALAACVLAACSGTPGNSPDARSLADPTPTVRHTPRPTETVQMTPLPTPKAVVFDFSKEPEPAGDAATLAQQLILVEKAIRDTSLPVEQLKWYGHLHQKIFSRLNDFPDWKEPVIALLPAEHQTPVRVGLEAGRNLRQMGGAPRRELPKWEILTPPAPEVLVGYYKEAESRFGVPWYYLASINLIESRMGRIRGESWAGARGPMQFMPPTWGAYGMGGDVWEPRDAIMGAANYLKASGAPANMPKAIFAYNRSQLYVNAVTFYAEAMRIDPSVYRGYYGWQVYYGTQDGVFHLPEGWKGQ